MREDPGTFNRAQISARHYSESMFHVALGVARSPSNVLEDYRCLTLLREWAGVFHLRCSILTRNSMEVIQTFCSFTHIATRPERRTWVTEYVFVSDTTRFVLLAVEGSSIVLVIILISQFYCMNN